ncbi:hypothetical protein Plec18167_009587 [Paecilomyces lecythidis]|uniref:Sister chromatid cohesion protein Ctf8 n=1 Tax=Paecilomyces lecythidis TaxID=3004212 RepID=A0ABR3WMU6_9EURO
MPSVTLHPRAAQAASQKALYNPLPQLLQTPSGLAILELQGTINIPSPGEDQDTDEGRDMDLSQGPEASVVETQIGKLMFPEYSPQNPADDTKWMKRVYLYIGKYQRMTGEVKKLPKPLAVIQRRQRPDAGDGNGATAATNTRADTEDELEIVEIVKYKILFGSRPEPLVNE